MQQIVLKRVKESPNYVRFETEATAPCKNRKGEEKPGPAIAGRAVYLHHSLATDAQTIYVVVPDKPVGAPNAPKPATSNKK